MPLAAESLYDELSGAEVKAILLKRVSDLLDAIPDFQKHLTLPRVRMVLNIHLDIYGRRNPAIDIFNDFTIKTREPEGRMEIARQLEASDTVSADTGAAIVNTPFDGTGEPPDFIREEHGLPLMEPVRDRATMSHAQRPVHVPPPEQPQAPPRPRAPNGMPYAAWQKIERAGPVVMGNVEYLPGSEPWTKTPSTERDKPEVGIQKDFRSLSQQDK